jgi:hypothetical protein
MSAETIVLKPELREFLEHSAQQEERSVNDLVNEALEYYFHTRQVEKINQEIAAYEAMHPMLWEKMPGHWVAIHNLQMVDHDVDDVALYRRVRAKYGHTSILIRQVKESPVEQVWIRTRHK